MDNHLLPTTAAVDSLLLLLLLIAAAQQQSSNIFQVLMHQCECGDAGHAINAGWQQVG